MVKRFDVGTHFDGGVIVDSDNGDYVEHEDYATLETEHKSAMLTISAIMEMLGVTEVGSVSEQVAALLKERDALAVENAGLKQEEIPLGAIENGRAFADRLEAYPFECQGGNLNMCSDWQEFRQCFEHLSEWAMHSHDENLATDAAIANIQAHAIPDGWKLIPEELHISEEGIELICSQCGNGDEEYGEFVDGVFRVGEVETDDGKKVYGLHVTCADYPEEGSVTIAIFDNPLRKESTHD